MSAYHVKRDGKLYGPFSVDQVAKCLNTNIFTAKDTISEDQITWITVNEFREQWDLKSAPIVDQHYPEQPENRMNVPSQSVNQPPNSNPPAHGMEAPRSLPAYVEQYAAAGNFKKKKTYDLLAVIFGQFGIHDFYAGYIFYGILKIVITLLGVGIASIIWTWYDIFNVVSDAKGNPLVYTPTRRKIYIILAFLGGLGGWHYIYAGFYYRAIISQVVLALIAGVFAGLAMTVGVTGDTQLTSFLVMMWVMMVGLAIAYVATVIWACTTRKDAAGNDFI